MSHKWRIVWVPHRRTLEGKSSVDRHTRRQFRVGSVLMHIVSVVSSIAICALPLSCRGFSSRTRSAEERLSEIGPTSMVWACRRNLLVASRDFSKIGFVEDANGGFRVCVNAATGETFDSIVGGSLRFSANGERTAYAAWRANRVAAVVDGVIGDWFEELLSGPDFSLDGSRVAYSVREGESRLVIVDGRVASRSLLFPKMTLDLGMTDYRHTFSPRGARLAFVIQRGARQALVVDGKTYGDYGDIGEVTFSPDGVHWAASTFTVIGATRFSGTETRETVITDTKEFETPGIINHTLSWSANSQELAYAIRDGDSYFMVRNGSRGLECQLLRARAIYASSGGHWAYVAQRHGQSVLVVDDSEVLDGDSILSTTFSPDGSNWACVSLSDDAQAMTTAKGVSDTVTAAEPLRLQLSADGMRLAYAAKLDGKWYVIIDGQRSRGYDDIGALAFSQDSRHVVFEGLRSGNLHIVVDGVEGKPYKYVPGMPLGFAFSSASSFDYIRFEAMSTGRPGFRVLHVHEVFL